MGLDGDRCGRGKLHDVAAVGREGAPAVREAHHHRAGRRHHHRAPADRVGADRGEHHDVELGLDHRAAGRQRVGGGAGRGGDDEAVGGVARDLLIADKDLDIDDLRRCRLLDNDLVQRGRRGQRLPADGRGSASRRRRTGQGPEPVHVAELLGRALR